jgi:outer membrane protein, adhesin transport system
MISSLTLHNMLTRSQVWKFSGLCATAMLVWPAVAMQPKSEKLPAVRQLQPQAKPQPQPAQTPLTIPEVTLSSLFQSALQSYPALQASRLDARAADQDVTAVQRSRWPTLSLVMESDTGSTRSLPSKSMQLEQTLWDFGRIRARIDEAQAAAKGALVNVYVKQQDLYLQLSNAWFSMIGAKDRMQVAQDVIRQLQGYRAQMLRRVEAQASPPIDLELVDARILQSQVELTTAESSHQIAITRLEQLSGEENLKSRLRNLQIHLDRPQLQTFQNQAAQTSWMQIAAENPQVEKARLDTEQIKNRLEAKKSEAWPQIYLRVNQPTGTIPPLYTDTKATAFVGVRYTPGAGMSNWVESQAMVTRMASSEQQIESVMREVQQTLQNDYEDFISARVRVTASENAVKGAEMVHQSYRRQFEASKKTWQDLLNAVRELAQNRYALAEAQSAMLSAKSRLQIRMGQEPQ